MKLNRNEITYFSKNSNWKTFRGDEEFEFKESLQICSLLFAFLKCFDCEIEYTSEKCQVKVPCRICE